MRVVALFRVSTEAQANEGASLDAQERLYRERAEQSGWITVGEFRGCESASGAASERAVLQRVLACIQAERPDAVYVHEQSRLTRGDELEVAVLLRELREQRVKVLIGGAVRDLASVDERFMVGIQGLVDRAESERIRERSDRGKREKALRGKKNSGPAPFGYRNPPVGHPQRGTLQVVPDEADVVRRVFAWASEGHSTRVIADRLNTEGVPTRRGSRWGKSSVKRLLENPAYIGTHVTSAWVPIRPGSRTFRFEPDNPRAIKVEHAHEPIVSSTLWEAVHGRPKPVTHREPRLLTGMLHIEGQPASGEFSHDERYYRARRAGSGRPWLRAGPTERTVWAALVRAVMKPEMVLALCEEARGSRDRDKIRTEIRRQEHAASKLERRLGGLTDMRADGEIDQPTYAEKRGQIERDTDEINARIDRLRKELAALDPDYARRVLTAVRVFAGGIEKMTGEQQRSVLHSVVRKADVSVEPTGSLPERGESGRFIGGQQEKWSIRSVTFDMVPPLVGGTRHSDTTC